MFTFCHCKPVVFTTEKMPRTCFEFQNLSHLLFRINYVFHFKIHLSCREGTYSWTTVLENTFLLFKEHCLLPLNIY